MAGIHWLVLEKHTGYNVWFMLTMCHYERNAAVFTYTFNSWASHVCKGLDWTFQQAWKNQ